MAFREEPRRPSIANRAGWLLASPLCASVAVGGSVLVANRLAGAEALGAGEDASWALLILLGPSIPLYLVLLPLFPFVLRALRRGWAPAPGPILATTLLAAAAFDVVFWLSRW